MLSHILLLAFLPLANTSGSFWQDTVTMLFIYLLGGLALLYEINNRHKKTEHLLRDQIKELQADRDNNYKTQMAIIEHELKIKYYETEDRLSAYEERLKADRKDADNFLHDLLYREQTIKDREDAHLQRLAQSHNHQRKPATHSDTVTIMSQSNATSPQPNP